jgi:hypothetical protein
VLRRAIQQTGLQAPGEGDRVNEGREEVDARVEHAAAEMCKKRIGSFAEEHGVTCSFRSFPVRTCQMKIRISRAFHISGWPGRY